MIDLVIVMRLVSYMYPKATILREKILGMYFRGYLKSRNSIANLGVDKKVSYNWNMVSLIFHLNPSPW